MSKGKAAEQRPFLGTKRTHASGRAHAVQFGKRRSGIEGRIGGNSCFLRVWQGGPSMRYIKLSPCLEVACSPAGILLGSHGTLLMVVATTGMTRDVSYTSSH